MRLRIAYFHNWSWLGSSIAYGLLAADQHDLWLVGGHRPRAEWMPGLVEATARRSAPCTAPMDVASPRFIERLRGFAPHLIVVATFPSKLPPAILAIPEFAAINIHSSLLPRYRGAAPEYWALRNGELGSGVTIHHLSERFDTGPIIGQAGFPLTPAETLLSLSIKAVGAAGPLLNQILDDYRRGARPAGLPQDESQATPAPMPGDAHLAVPWAEPATVIERHVRAANPMFECHSRFRAGRVTISSVRVIPEQGLRPGELRYDSETRQLRAGTGQGGLILEWLRLADGVSTAGDQFARDSGITDGEMFV